MYATDGSSGSQDYPEDEYAQDTWISEFIYGTDHELYCEVPEDFIEDDFNLTGLSALVPNYREALELILDLEPEIPEGEMFGGMETVEASSELLYGLIHARYLTTRPGLETMAQKYEYGDFGTCPRYLCKQTGLLPIGRHDIPGIESVRFYCPCCNDIYDPQSPSLLNVDGAFFGTSYAGLLLKTFPTIERDCQDRRKRSSAFELSIYGFKISENSRSGPRMKWLRKFPDSDEEMKEADSIELIELDSKDEEGNMDIDVPRVMA